MKAQVLELDTEKRRLKLGMKQLVPTSIDEYLAEHQLGDVVSGRVIEVSGDSAQAELGEGILAVCTISTEAPKQEATKHTAGAGTDLASLSSMLAARWKSGTVAESSKPQEIQPGRCGSFASPNWIGHRRRSKLNWRSADCDPRREHLKSLTAHRSRNDFRCNAYRLSTT